MIKGKRFALRLQLIKGKRSALRLQLGLPNRPHDNRDPRNIFSRGTIQDQNHPDIYYAQDVFLQVCSYTHGDINHCKELDEGLALPIIEPAFLKLRYLKNHPPMVKREMSRHRPFSVEILPYTAPGFDHDNMAGVDLMLPPEVEITEWFIATEEASIETAEAFQKQILKPLI